MEKAFIHIKIIFFILPMLVLTSLNGYSQEICDNALDDDGDGLIDLNDPECFCSTFVGSSLIPNPSFEERTCCPNSNEMLNCAIEWIQASAATSDYVHTCAGYLGNTSIPAFAPLPFPDGEGGVGFRDGQRNAGPNYKEYVGACLTEPMIIGTEYRLDFYVGFQDNRPGSRSFDIAFFGSADCGNLPFGGDDWLIGCPVNTGDYSQLATLEVSGDNEWVNVVVEFVADQAYEVLVIGPSCSGNPNYLQDPYFYIDGLNLAESSEFGIPYDFINGSICDGDLELGMSEISQDQNFQWYKDGIALNGQTDPIIGISPGNESEGIYLLSIIDSIGCTSTREYEVRLPPYYFQIDTSICESDFFAIDSLFFDSTGYYEVLLPAEDGCDSIVQLNLSINPLTDSELYDFFCVGEDYELGNFSTEQAGIFEVVLNNQYGCDSTILLTLEEINPSRALRMDSVFTLVLGEAIDIIPDSIGPEIRGIDWFDENNNLIHQGFSLENFQLFNSAPLYLDISDQWGCTYRDTIEIRVNKENIRLYVPNVFSPNEDGANDIFNFYFTNTLESIELFEVFDRWGNRVYSIADSRNPGEIEGWDGRLNGQYAQTGIYSYHILVNFIDGSSQRFKGDVLLIR